MNKEERQFAHLLTTPTVGEIEAMMGRGKEKRRLFPASDKEITEAITDYGGFPNVDFRRVGGNVVVADGCVVVAVKPFPENLPSLYVIEGCSLQDPMTYEHIKGKVWASETILSQIRKASHLIVQDVPCRQP